MFVIKISVDFEMIFFILLMLFSKKIKLYLGFLFFILLHELTHLVVGLIVGVKPKELRIMPIGFKIEFKAFKRNKNLELKKILIALAGPVINLIIMFIFILLDNNRTFVYMNLLIALFNLVPIYPLDGGRIIKSILNIKIGLKESYKYTNKVSNISIIILTGIRKCLNFVHEKY